MAEGFEKPFVELSIDNNKKFDYVKEIINLCLNKNLKSWFKGVYPWNGILSTNIVDRPCYFWFPKLSKRKKDGSYSDTDGWVNKIIDNGCTIAEENIKGKKHDCDFNNLRIVFSKSSQEQCYEFSGVFYEDPYESNDNRHIYRRIATKVKFPKNDSLPIEIFEDTNNPLSNEIFEEASFLESFNNIPKEEIDKSVNYIPKPEKKKNYEIVNDKKVFPRDKKVSLVALQRANNKCEINPDGHKSFIRKSNGTRYMEPHHLIPMSFQERFESSLDVPANIISLCSECHNMIHYGVDRQKAVDILYLARKEELEKAGIQINKEDLLRMYK